MLEKFKNVYDRIDEYKEVVASDPYRLRYHIMPPVGLLNDPNGFVFYKGQYHVFYQWNPFEPEHGAKFWGHYISDDLISWKEAPVALAPDMWYDKNGCYSGSAVVFNDRLYVFYTGNVKDEEGHRKSYQCLAISDDGIHFEKKGPVIHVPEGYTAHFRDPKVFYETDKWYMVIGAQTEKIQGAVVVYTSSDLETWHFQGPLIESGDASLEAFGYMWECPDLFTLDGKDILVVCPQGLSANGYVFNNIYQSGYFAGSVDYEAISFNHDSFVELDRGFDFYAPQTMEDEIGRRILIGWMGNAEETVIQPTVKHEWIHALTIPRELEWKNDKLLQRPVGELYSLRSDEIRFEDVTIEDNMELPEIYGNVFELELTVNDLNADRFTVGIGEASRIVYDTKTKVFTFERASLDGTEEVERRHCQLEHVAAIRIFKDTSSVEIFVNGGEEVFTSRVFDHPEAEGITFSAYNGTVQLDVAKWNLGKGIDD
ncbi:beta-fructofuranosidase [Virgibacillus natechei]|uniref:Sucrose-6-phosphate hydrolase n=1 Tax=Virgibacillus natechei TaxID=1216297 RepID=A0ABS4IKC0_9BACI|nr:glycoside hydrolase family 32 protein [Virgibacillus natechei]MBP1971382.1 beta-fructofuranosidase [Virgibacillus natechei]UZD12245.1 glycoside hydrolase family 32 protein [Virgibacillus natechei]